MVMHVCVMLWFSYVLFLNDTATTEIYTA